ncbi:MAG: LLM class F420-dependent oxidoreductase [Chloroflexia bacterium]
MLIGAIFPQTEIGDNPTVLRDYAQAVEQMGFNHLVAYDHVLGASVANRPDWGKRYTENDMFHEPFVLFGYLAALTQKLEFVTGVIVLPQRQTALVAKQAVEIDVLSGGRFRLGVGVGWNPVEFEALGEDFSNRGKRSEEQITLLKRLFESRLITFEGKYHTVREAGLNPMPVRRDIPIWIGGSSDITLQRIAHLADGWFPNFRPEPEGRQMVERLRELTIAANRDPKTIGIEAKLRLANGLTPDQLAHEARQWREIGATHIDIDTMGSNFTSLHQHLDALEQAKKAIE